jgi:hypothetical protein
MNSTLTRIAVTVKNGDILPTPSSKKIGTLPTITYKPLAIIASLKIKQFTHSQRLQSTLTV